MPDVPFGALIVDRRTGEVVAEGWNKSSTNPTWHGEIDAINRLAELQPEFDGNQLVLYTTAEPCRPIQKLIRRERLTIVAVLHSQLSEASSICR